MRYRYYKDVDNMLKIYRDDKLIVYATNDERHGKNNISFCNTGITFQDYEYAKTLIDRFISKT